jgi:cation diffusion facilitator CzcD-associated flavoprotein CzcO
MPYRSHPYSKGTAEYPTYEVIYRYQKEHAAEYANNIRLNRVVTRIRHGPPDRVPSKRWLVEWSPSVTTDLPEVGKTFEEEFDHVVVANGSDSRPFIPWIDNLWSWKGEILHSRWYRDAKAFSGKVIYSFTLHHCSKPDKGIDSLGSRSWPFK